MKKNSILRSAAMMLPASAAILTGCSDSDAEPKSEAIRNGDGKYNIIFITCDQEAYMQEYPEGSNYEARKRLRELGTTFEKHYSCANVSTSSRSVIYTGRHITETCMLDNTNYQYVSDMPDKLPINDKMSLTIGTVGDMMQKAGYYPAYKGKWHITKDTESLAEYGFLDWTEGDMYGSVLEGYHEDGMIADHAIEWLKGKGKQLNNDGKSFFLAVNFLNPHDIMYFGENAGTYIAGTATPAPDDPIYKKTYPTPVPASWNEPFDKPGRPAAHDNYNRQWQAWVGPSPQSEAGWHTFRDYYFNTIQDEDNHMLKFLNYLDEAGLMKNTVIIYTADHGEMQGAHGLKGKGGFIYENNIHVPLIIVHPEVKGGQHFKNLSSHIDLAPTFVDIATEGDEDAFKRITLPLRGHSLIPAIKDINTDIRNTEGALWCFDMISMIDGDFTLVPHYGADMNKRGFVRAIITPEYKFARYFAPKNFNTPENFDDLVANNDVELFQMGTDETDNLAYDGSKNYIKERVISMNQRLNNLIRREITRPDDGRELDVCYQGGIKFWDRTDPDFGKSGF
jgi:arylsulfatase